MLLIECPYCGARPEIEFRCGGDAHVERPGPHDQVSGKQWAEYLYYRDNPKGLHRERWVHQHGCRQWFNLVRDTVSHDIVKVYPITQKASEIDSGESQ